MMLNKLIAQFRAAFSRDRIRTESIAIALLALVVSLVLGSSARAKATPVRMEISRLRALRAELSSFRASFRPGGPDLEALRLPDSLAVSVAREVRVALAHDVTARAERSGLVDVRVRFAPVDTSVVAPVEHPEFFGSTTAVADYTVSIDCRGGLAAVLSLVNHLPPSVALQKLTAANTKDGTAEYHLTLAVFEAQGSSSNSRASANSNSAATGASEHG